MDDLGSFSGCHFRLRLFYGTEYGILLGMEIIPTEDIVSVTNVKADLAGTLEQCRTKHRPTFITQNGRAAGVIMAVEDWEVRERTLELYRRVAEGEESLGSGKIVGLDEAERLIRDKHGL